MIAIRERIVNMAHKKIHQLREEGEENTVQCCLCGKEDEKINGLPDIMAHHPDYGRPLFVVWLCSDCHLQHHDDMMMVKLLDVINSLKEYLFRKDENIISNRGTIRGQSEEFYKYCPDDTNKVRILNKG